MRYSAMSERCRTEHTAALAVRVPIARTVQFARGADGKLYLDIETCDTNYITNARGTK